MNAFKYVAVAAASACLAVSLAGCSGQAANGASSSSAASSSTAVTAIDFDGSKCHDTGKGTLYLQTDDGQTSKNGDVPQLQTDTSTEAAQITLVTKKMTGKSCEVYIDGVENTKIKPGTGRITLALNADSLEAGTHKVELVHWSKGQISVYKSAKYEVVEASEQS